MEIMFCEEKLKNQSERLRTTKKNKICVLRTAKACTRAFKMAKRMKFGFPLTGHAWHN